MNAQNTNGSTCLMIAAHEGFVKVMEELIAAGAEVNRRNALGWNHAVSCCRGRG